MQVVEIKHYIEQKFDLIVPLEKFFEDLTVAQLAQDILTLANLPQESQHHQNGHLPKRLS